VDETMQEILDAIKRIGAKWLVIDSPVSFEMVLSPGFSADFRESLYRMIGALMGAGITIVSKVEGEGNFTSFQFPTLFSNTSATSLPSCATDLLRNRPCLTKF
jgi:circadian clock protein KaiC